MANYLFTLTISPVQEFIFQARKTKDLFAGSEILSQLMQKVRNKLNEVENAEIIFPQSEVSLSNKVIVEIKNVSEEEVKTIGEKLEKGINFEFINKIFIETCKYESNLHNFFQVYWVAIKLNENYIKAYNKLENRLGAIKNLRKFEQKPQKAGEKKCIVCGERNQDKEELCLVCLAKRKCKLDDKQDYPSTAKIALLDWLEGLNYNELKKLKDVNGENFDEQWLFEYKKKDEKIKNKFEDWFEKNQETLKERKQKNFYTLIHFDIDDMGKYLSSLDKDNQIKLSKKIGEFAKKAKDIVNKYGKTIYAGGDDFLGFVNLAYLFKTIDEIYCDFESVDFDEILNDFTFSTSIIIAHYKAPLHKVLDYSRNLLKEAKNHFEDKDGLGIMVMSSNAINAKTICRYEDLELLKDMLEQNIGVNLHYKLKTIFSFLDDKTITYTEYKHQIEMLEYEIKRLLKREQGSFNKEMYQKLIKLLQKQVSGLNTENSIIIDFDNFIGYLKTLEQLKKVM